MILFTNISRLKVGFLRANFSAKYNSQNHKMWFSPCYPQNCGLQTTDELLLAFTAGECEQRAISIHLSRKAHSKYVSRFDTDKIHANKLANKAALLRFWEMAKEAVLSKKPWICPDHTQSYLSDLNVFHSQRCQAQFFEIFTLSLQL